MTYRAGIGPGMEALGLTPGLPQVWCDEPGCTAIALAVNSDGRPYQWILKGTAPRGWRTEREGDRRRDFCPQHRTEASNNEMRDTLVGLVLARVRGAPFTWRNANTAHRRMLKAKKLGLVEPLKTTRAKVFWGLTDAGEKFLHKFDPEGRDST